MKAARCGSLLLASVLTLVLGQVDALALTIAIVPDGSEITPLDGASVVETASVTLRGTVSSADAVSVTVGGAAASFEAADRSWQGDAALSPGLNRVDVEALDAGDAVVESGSIDLILVPASNHAGGTLTENATFSGAYIIDTTATVAAGTVLTIEPGCILLFESSASLVVRGQLLAQGTEADRIRFTHRRDGTTWQRILFSGADDSSLRHCVIEYSDSEGDHKDYYDTRDSDCNPVENRPPRDYHEAVVVVASHVDIHGCTFQKLPDAGGSPEGDAIAVISDDIEQPGDASANITSCEFLSIGQGVHTRYAYVLVEDCYFTDHHGDNDDVDLYGESAEPPMIRNNVFLNPAHDDMINPTRCSAVIIGNLIAGCDDHGVVLRDRSTPVMINNVIYDCNSAGVAVQNQCDALLVNNTIVDCGRGVRFFDHTGRWGLPYCLNPGSGKATLINCVIWDCPTTLSLRDSPYEGDRGSHVTVSYCDIQGGQDRISTSTHSTITWLDGNIDADPLFVDMGHGDLHVRADSPLVDAGTADQAPATDIEGTARPCGAGVDMGAFEYCDEAPITFRRGDPNADGEADISDAVTVLLYLFAGGDAPPCLKSADINDDGVLEITDSIHLLHYLFLAGEAPAAPFADCGPDATADALSCNSYPPCP